MPKIKFIVVDRTRSSFLKKGELFFLDRLKNYSNVEWIEVKSVKIKKSASLEEIVNKEGLSIGMKLSSADYVVALDRQGHQLDSEGLADWLAGLILSARGPVCFVIGGPLGLSQEILSRADKILSLSRLTFTHEMCRLFLVEQIYRSFTIIRGEKYHK
ncbi:MAG: 23S rRNA (pseudouridine(1915)-N(3))-methyltransferase RlmH [Deltaproteobacteria bacterium]|nr:23S rRNA (pseudouridine(1915)-N(3))-methyltransferase RlmH [Deltaproteobacteria bacterium]